MSGGSPFGTTGKLVIAHPTRVAQADQVAAAEAIKRVELRNVCSTKYVYVLDLDKIMKLPERWRW